MLKAVELNPNNKYNWYWLGNSYIGLKDYYSASKSYEKGIEIESDNCEMLNNYGVALADLNRIEETRIAYSKALEIHPNYELAMS